MCSAVVLAASTSRDFSWE